MFLAQEIESLLYVETSRCLIGSSKDPEEGGEFNVEESIRQGECVFTQPIIVRNPSKVKKTLILTDFSFFDGLEILYKLIYLDKFRVFVYAPQGWVQLTDVDTLYEIGEDLIKLYPGQVAIPDDFAPYSYISKEDLAGIAKSRVFTY